ncbi:hypothetical protein GIS00_06470 [Nakamurella sp. YIM 132087]|uniref:Uncharacterized protein n=1 Tax=Nakamurella alba TaxID=2665158 RepID=A0A7K1FHI4_9ACTN|nr:hypothetical protein [Nakamurella alba]MTD13587.1 hypothetical protein [Nakamurella alba]
MTLLIVLFLLVALAVAAPFLGRDSRPTGFAKWGDQSADRGPVARW